MNCTKCGGQMEPGIALVDVMSGVPDFAGDGYVCTVSPSGRAVLADCLKCETCGASVVKQQQSEEKDAS